MLQIPAPGSVEGDSLNGCDAFVTGFVSIFVINFVTTLRRTASSSELSAGLGVTQGHLNTWMLISTPGRHPLGLWICHPVTSSRCRKRCVIPQGEPCRFHQRSSCDGNSERWDCDLGKGQSINSGRCKL